MKSKMYLKMIIDKSKMKNKLFDFRIHQTQPFEKKVKKKLIFFLNPDQQEQMSLTPNFFGEYTIVNPDL